MNSRLDVAETPADLTRAALRSGPRPPGVTSARGAALVELIRSALASLDGLEPAEQDAIVSALVANLQARRPPRRGP